MLAYYKISNSVRLTLFFRRIRASLTELASASSDTYDRTMLGDKYLLGYGYLSNRQR